MHFLEYMSRCTICALRLRNGLFLNLKTEGRAGLFKSMGISQPRTGFEHIWSVCGGKLEPVQLKVHREWLILFHIIFFSAAKEWHTSVVCPCCLLGKEYLSSSDRCWHYNPCVLPGAGTRPVHRHEDLQELARDGRDRQRRIDSEWARWPRLFWLEPKMTLLLWSSSIRLLKKIDSSWAPLASGIKRKGNWQA